MVTLHMGFKHVLNISIPQNWGNDPPCDLRTCFKMSENLPIFFGCIVGQIPPNKWCCLLLEVSEVFLEFWRVFVESGNISIGAPCKWWNINPVFLGQDDTMRWLFGAYQNPSGSIIYIYIFIFLWREPYKPFLPTANTPMTMIDYMNVALLKYRWLHVWFILTYTNHFYMRKRRSATTTNQRKNHNNRVSPPRLGLAQG